MIYPPQKRKETASATLAQTIMAMAGCSALAMLVTYAADPVSWNDPSWWSNPGTGSLPAVMYEQVVTNADGSLTTNYVANDNTVVLQGQLKEFTVRAVDEMNAALPGGAGTNLNSMVMGWAQDYATNNYGNTNSNPHAPYKPSDLTAMNVGQLKAVGSMVWSQLVSAGYTNAMPSWLGGSNAADVSLATISQLKTVFNFNLAGVTLPPVTPILSTNAVISGISGQNICYTVPANNTTLSYSASGLPSGLTINPQTGMIFGSSTNSGVYTVIVTATNTVGSATETLTLNLGSATNTYPNLQSISAPNPEPTLPSAVDPYTPPVSVNAPATGAPVISEWTRIAQPRNVVVLAGSQFTSYTDQRAGQDTQFYAYAQTAQGAVSAVVPLLRANATGAAILLPSNFPSNSEVLIWPINSAGAGYPVAINATETWWIGPNVAAAGDTVSVFGRNLADVSGSSFISNVYIQAAGQTGVWATIACANPYKVDFTVPLSLAPGAYQVWVHNDRGGQYGWSGPLTLTVNGGAPWIPTSTGTYNVKTSFGAMGDGVTDDTASIQNAINAAMTNAWSTVYFPTGIYMISSNLTARSQTRWMGDGATNSIIRANTNFDSSRSSGMIYIPPFGTIAANNITIQNLAVEPNGNFSSATLPVISATSVNDVKFINDIIGGVGSAPVNLASSNLIFLKNCKIFDGSGSGGGGNGVFLGGANQVFIDHCQFYGSDDVNTMVDCFGGSDGISFTYNTGQDYNDSMPNGWAQGRFFYGASTWGPNRDIYVGNNTTTGLAVRPGVPNQNTGEQLLWEVGTQYQGSPSLVTSNSVTYSTYIPTYDTSTGYGLSTNSSYTVAIVAGTGMGQFRDATTSTTNNTLTVIPPWTIPPDTNSIVAVTAPIERCVVYQNTLQGKSSYTTNNTASTGIDPGGDAFDFIADGNTISQVRYGITSGGYAESRPADAPPEITVDFFNYFANNTIFNSYLGIENVSDNWQNYSVNSYAGTPNIGNTWANNSLDGIVTNAISTAPNSLIPFLPGDQYEYNVFDRNSVVNTSVPISISVGPSINNTIIYNNSLTLGTNAATGSAGIYLGNGQGAVPTLRFNIYAGFQTPYGGQTISTPTIESPAHVVFVYGTTQGSVVHGTLPLWDAGTGPLYWKATTSTSWLTLGSSQCGVSPETGSSGIDLACNPSSLTAGSYTGTVTAIGSGQTRNYTVNFVVSPVP